MMKNIRLKRHSQIDINVDESEIDAKYDKAHMAVEVVRSYDSNLLQNISTIADLSAGAYGLYNSGENIKEIPDNVREDIRYVFRGNIDEHQIDGIPKKVLMDYFNQWSEHFPDVNPNELATSIKEGDTIRVNIARILSESSSHLEAVLEIASTIVHEATHEIERETQGMTSESGPEVAERQFYSWASANIQNILSRYPELDEGQTQADEGQDQIAAESNWKNIFSIS